MSDLPDVADAILTEVEFLNGGQGTCSLGQCEKSLRLQMRLTLSDTTSRLGIFWMRLRSSKSLPQRLRFLMLWRLSDFVLVKTKSAVRGFPTFLLLIIQIYILSIYQ